MSPKQRKIYNKMNKTYTKLEQFALWLNRWLCPKCDSCESGRIAHEGTTITQSGVALELYKCDRCGKKYV